MAMDLEPGDARARARHAAAPVQLSHWEGAMRRAQAAARLGLLVQAQGACRHALHLARELLAAPPAGREDDCVAALVVSLHGLADLHAGEGAVEAAAVLRAEAHEALLVLLADASHGMALQQAAWRHSRETHAGLLCHVAQHGSHPAIARALQAGCRALASAGGPAPH